MNAEALIGMVLGTCTLQKLIGQGGMGAVFLAQQSRPKRQVAVKVLLPMTPLAPNQHSAFLERFRRETDAAASLVHPNIMPVHEYGERDGLAYLVMPYISGGTLRDELEREGPLPLAKVVNYLDQMAAALGTAHECGVIHRDVKPANILMTPEERLVLSDFGLVKIVVEGKSAQARLTGIGVPMGTPDYMAPEQVLGEEVDGRADLYSLGCILYHMITGMTPFRGEMPMQIAMQHLHTPPQPPHTLRPDLPPVAEQVILRALAKHPADRYMRAQDFASAFRVALTAAGVRIGDNLGSVNGPDPMADSKMFTPRGLFDPMWQKNKRAAAAHVHGMVEESPASPISPMSPVASPPASSLGRASDGGMRKDIVAQTSMTLPSFSGILPPVNNSMGYQSDTPVSPPEQKSMNTSQPPVGMRGGRKTSLLRTMDGFSAFSPSPDVPSSNMASAFVPDASFGAPGGEQDSDGNPFDPSSLFSIGEMGQGRQVAGPGAMGTLAEGNNAPGMKSVQAEANKGSAGTSPGEANGRNGATRQLSDEAMEQAAGQNKPETTTGTLGWSNNTYGGQGLTGALMIPTGESGGQGTTSMVKLTQSVKVVKVPVAGQPGQYMTGLLPVVRPMTEPTPPAEAAPDNSLQGKIKRHMKVIALVAVVFLVLASTGMFWVASRSTNTQGSQSLAGATPNAAATAAVQASATAQAANVILEDPLRENIHNWPSATKGTQMFFFKDGAYHIANNNNSQLTAFALLPDETVSGSFIYTLDVDEIKGDDTTFDNQFGLVFNYTARQKAGKSASTFYFFGVANMNPGGEYLFGKYDDGFGKDVSPWTTLWQQKLGREYRFGHGPKYSNTFKVAVNGKSYTLYVNEKKLATVQDTSLTSGQIGMMVNLKGTEVAFSNLKVTNK